MLAVAVLALGTMLFPVLRPLPAARVRRGGRAAIAGATRAGADLAPGGARGAGRLAATPVLRRLDDREQHHGRASIRCSCWPPALALVGGTVITLRLLPAAARTMDRFAARGRKPPRPW